MEEKIVKYYITTSINKYGEIVDVPETEKIEVDVKYDELNPLCKDFLNMLKRDDVLSFSILTVGYNDEIKRIYWDLVNISKIEFKEYYLSIDGYIIFYNAIFNYRDERRW